MKTVSFSSVMDANEKRMELRRKALDAARDFRDFVGDGNNGPPEWLSEQWYAFDRALRELDGDVPIETVTKKEE